MINTRTNANRKFNNAAGTRLINKRDVCVLLKGSTMLTQNILRNFPPYKRGGMDMYLDKEIPINFHLPLSLQNDIKELDEDFSNGNDLHFAMVLDIFEATVKQSYINGNITAEQLNLLFRRYGLR